MDTKRSLGEIERSVIGYCRVSTDEQGERGIGLDAQRETIQREAERRGWRLVAVHQDVMTGATVNGRQGLTEAVDAIESGKASALLVAKLDRLSRSLADFATLMERARRHGWEVVVADLGIDTTSPTGELLSSVVASMSAYERRLIGQRTKEALAVLKRRGVRLGRPPQVPMSVVRLAARRRRAGKSLAAIADELNAKAIPCGQSGRRWWPSTVRKLLMRAD